MAFVDCRCLLYAIKSGTNPNTLLLRRGHADKSVFLATQTGNFNNPSTLLCYNGWRVNKAKQAHEDTKTGIYLRIRVFLGRYLCRLLTEMRTRRKVIKSWYKGKDVLINLEWKILVFTVWKGKQYFSFDFFLIWFRKYAFYLNNFRVLNIDYKRFLWGS